MKVSHEVPLALLEMSRFFNDYDYALVHLFEKYPGYLKFYQDSLAMGRTVYLDNSLYELGKAFDPEQYLEWINLLKPTYYIIPDTFWDTDATMRQAMEWFLHQVPKAPQECKTIGVCQGSSYEDIRRCYRFMSSLVDMVAFTFKFPDDFVDRSGEAFREEYKGFRQDILGDAECATYEDIQAIIRYTMLKMLWKDCVIDRSKPHHLLGCQNTLMLHDISSYFGWITSIDTSNPVMCAYQNDFYRSTDMKPWPNADGFPKPTTVLADVFEKPLPEGPFMGVLGHNVMSFRRIVNNGMA